MEKRKDSALLKYGADGVVGCDGGQQTVSVIHVPAVGMKRPPPSGMLA